jgi:hypothetical protein
LLFQENNSIGLRCKLMKNEKKSQKTVLQFNEVRNKTKHFMAVQKNGWAIKFSIYDEYHILLMMISIHTSQLIIRYYLDENDAVKFINRITSEDSQYVIEL